MRTTRMFMALTACVLVLALFPAASEAQFGKNQVMWEDQTWNFYRSAHFDIHYSVDIEPESARKSLENLVAHLEGSYEFISTNLDYELKSRPIVVVARTHSTFEALHLSGDPFIPEGVGAYALPRGSRLLPNTDLILAVKPDFLPVLNRTIYTHELVHIFQFDMIGWTFIRQVGGAATDRWLFEATADYLANLYAPYSRDDIRGIQQRVAAANVRNPMVGLPTLEMLRMGAANPYSYGAMVFQFLEHRYGREKTAVFIRNVFTDRTLGLGAMLEDISDGEFNSHEAFDRAHRAYWASQYVEDSMSRPSPYDETESFKGRQVLRRQYPYPLTSPVTSPDGTTVAFLTYHPKNGIVLATAPAREREDPEYVRHADRSKERRFTFGRRTSPNRRPLEVLTTFMPPKHYEYIVGQQLNVWPFNGSDLDWWQEPSWISEVRTAVDDVYEKRDALVAAQNTPPEYPNGVQVRLEAIENLEQELEEASKTLKELRRRPDVSVIAFFGRRNRDHALFLFDANTRKFLAEIEIPMDQGFSPAFSPDGQTVYFSAAEHIRRDIWAYERRSGVYRVVATGNVFSSAPAVSPDGTRLAYVAFVGGFQKLFLANIASGQSEQLTFGRWNDNAPSWSSDGERLAFASDAKDEIWNLYTLELQDRTVSQWTDFFGGVFAPRFASGEHDRLVYSAYLEDDQYRSFLYPNFELFDARLKSPLRTFRTVDLDPNENMALAFRPQEAVVRQLDQRQLDDPDKPPDRWKFYGSDMYMGTSTYFGMFGYSRVSVQDLLANRTHQGLFAQSGHLKVIDYSYTNTSKRMGWVAGASHYRYPLYYQLYSLEGKRPRYPSPNEEREQFFLNSMWIEETSITLAAQYPFDKFNRFEFGVRPRIRNYRLFDLNVLGPEERAGVPQIDEQLFRYFSEANGQANASVFGAFVQDTVLYSGSTMGPLHGTAARLQLEYGPGLNNKAESYTSVSADVRRYFRLTNSSLFAVRGAGMYSDRPTGDIMLLGGNDSLRTYPYMSVAGNQVLYGSGEFRFPLADVALLGAIPFRIRGSFFGDYAIAKFSQDGFPARKDWSYGIGLQTWLFLPMHFEWARTQYNPKEFQFNFRIGVTF